MTLFTNLHFSSDNQTWETPQKTFDSLDDEFTFTLDVCAGHDTYKCPRYFTVDDDGLTQDWGIEICWMNPPYGREIKAWMKKAYEASLQGATVVCLVPSRTDTVWWHDFVAKANEIRFIKGRLKFGGAKNPAPFPSAVVVFRP